MKVPERDPFLRQAQSIANRLAHERKFDNYRRSSIPRRSLWRECRGFVGSWPFTVGFVLGMAAACWLGAAMVWWLR